MKSCIVEKADDGRRLDRWLSAHFPQLPGALAQKFLRVKRIRLNGKGAQPNARVHTGDEISLYVDDALLAVRKKEDPFLSKFKPRLSVLYCDDQILLADKQPGLICVPDEREKVDTLINHVRAYLYQRGEWDPSDPDQFAPVLCNRIDRFTGGIVIAARTREAMQTINRAIRSREVEKRYLCVVHGRMKPPSGLMNTWILKPEGAKKVTVLTHPARGAQNAQTRYATLMTRGGLSLMECELLTGRTHQIRAQFAHAGCPLLGDAQYGRDDSGARYGRGYQALYAYSLTFHFSQDAGALNAVNGRTFRVKDVPFVRDFFPDTEEKE